MVQNEVVVSPKSKGRKKLFLGKGIKTREAQKILKGGKTTCITPTIHNMKKSTPM